MIFPDSLSHFTHFTHLHLVSPSFSYSSYLFSCLLMFNHLFSLFFIFTRSSSLIHSHPHLHLSFSTTSSSYSFTSHSLSYSSSIHFLDIILIFTHIFTFILIFASLSLRHHPQHHSHLISPHTLLHFLYIILIFTHLSFTFIIVYNSLSHHPHIHSHLTHSHPHIHSSFTFTLIFTSLSQRHQPHFPTAAACLPVAGDEPCKSCRSASGAYSRAVDSGQICMH